MAARVFGSPFFVGGGEPFWGRDRMQMMEAWIERGGWRAPHAGATGSAAARYWTHKF